MLVGMCMAEINRIDPWSSEPDDEFWQFFVRIKKHRDLAPVRLHRVPSVPEIDPVLTLIEIRNRGLRFKATPIATASRSGDRSRVRGLLPVVTPRVRGSLPVSCVPDLVATAPVSLSTPDDPTTISTGVLSNGSTASPGLLDENGFPYKNEQIRAIAKRTLMRAGIDEKRPYHIKHAMVSMLYKKRLPPEQIALFLRQKVDSSTFFNNYVSNDLGRQCSDAVVAEFTKVGCIFYFA
jgi:hypothetical protein